MGLCPKPRGLSLWASKKRNISFLYSITCLLRLLLSIALSPQVIITIILKSLFLSNIFSVTFSLKISDNSFSFIKFKCNIFSENWCVIFVTFSLKIHMFILFYILSIKAFISALSLIKVIENVL